VAHLLQGFVVDETGCILGDLELPLLYLLSELPVRRETRVLTEVINEMSLTDRHSECSLPSGDLT
jgi:hypothetical protein